MYRGLRPNGTTFYQSEIPLLLPPKFPGFFPKWKAPAILKEPVPRLIRMLECLSVIAFCAKSELIFLYERVYLQTRLFAVLQAFQAQVTSVECKFTFSQDSRCGVTGNRWDVVGEIKYWCLKCFLFSWPNRPQLGLRGWIFFPADDHLP